MSHIYVCVRALQMRHVTRVDASCHVCEDGGVTDGCRSFGAKIDTSDNTHPSKPLTPDASCHLCEDGGVTGGCMGWP